MGLHIMYYITYIQYRIGYYFLLLSNSPLWQLFLAYLYLKTFVKFSSLELGEAVFCEGIVNIVIVIGSARP